MNTTHQQLVLVTAATGKTGRRVADRLDRLGIDSVRASRGAQPSFDWEQPDTWPAALDGVTDVYLAYAPDVAAPGATETIGQFCAAARWSGAGSVVLLSGRGEPEAEAAEAVVKASGMRWTVVRASVFAQNFSEDFLTGSVAAGEVYLPVADVPEPFVDADDLADVAVAALTDPHHDAQTYDVTGPELLTFADAAAAISAATDRPLRVTSVSPADYLASAIADGVPEPIAAMLTDVFTQVLDGRNAHLGTGTLDALGRPAGTFGAYVRRAAAEGAWSDVAADGAHVEVAR